MRVIFMGTPDFAVPALEALCSSRHDVSLVVTQPDREKGRGKKIEMTPVKTCALAHHIPVFQPVKVKSEEAVSRLREEKPDVIVVAAFGQILSKEILDLPRFGCVNIHGSLLPKYRGAAPIQWAVLNGEEKSGITIMQMDEGIDTGDILLQEETMLSPKETTATLFERLSLMGGPLLLKALDQIEAGTITRTKQNPEEATYAKMLRREMGEISWRSSAEEIERKVRGMNPWPSAYTTWNGKQLKIWDCEVIDEDAGELPGVITNVEKQYFDVAAGHGQVRVEELQLEGKKRMKTADFLLGYHVKPGEAFTGRG